MVNIAQAVNVLQAAVLTEGAKMLLTPTYHVFEMYRAHQGARLLPAELSCPDYAFGGEHVPGGFTAVLPPMSVAVFKLQ